MNEIKDALHRTKLALERVVFDTNSNTTAKHLLQDIYMLQSIAESDHMISFCYALQHRSCFHTETIIAITESELRELLISEKKNICLAIIEWHRRHR